MEYILTRLLELLATDIGQYGFFALVLVWALVPFVGWLKRRARLRRFATEHELQFLGISVSDKREPYTQF